MILSSGPAVHAVAWPWLAGLLAMVAYAAAAWPSTAPGRWPAVALLVGWAAHALTLVLDILAPGDGQGVRFGFAPILSVTLWLVLGVYMVESRFIPLPGVRRVLALAGSAVVLLTAAFPGEMRGHAVTPLLPLHWLLGVASYGLFGAAVLHATMLDSAEKRMRLKSGPPAAGVLGMPLLRLERLTFRFVEAGFVVLSAALLLGLGSVQEWRWDHKTVFSVLGWATFGALIVGRHASGWRGRRATRWLYAGAVLLLLGYVGSRFVFEVVLQRQS
jgi:ABC-type uncharacterized transport system permease subunit